MKVLITGITGRVGANVAQKFLQNGHAVRGFVWPGDRQAVKMQAIGAEMVEGDLASSSDVRAAADGQEIILHLGAAFQAGGPFTPEQYMDTNVKGTFNILEAALGLGDQLQHVIVTSTDATMFKYPPNGIEEPIAENSLPLDSTGWYGYSKILCEHLVDRYYRHDQLRATVLRFANVWGAGEILQFPSFHLSTFLEQFKGRTDDAGKATYEKLQAADDGQPRLIIARDLDGRSWKKHNIEVRDIVHAYEQILGNKNSFGRTYQIGADKPFTWEELIPYMAKKMGIPYADIELAATPNYYEYDLAAARNDFGYSPQLSVFDMVDEAIRYSEEGGGGIIPTTMDS